jgi:exopolyphosphatase/guanosine-5'-triphosphate,3'-diphosphate pyrophosphatase
MREAYNGQEIVALIKEKSDVNIEIIDGKKQLLLLRFTSLIKQRSKLSFFFVDGGSTEFTIFSNGKLLHLVLSKEQCVY